MSDVRYTRNLFLRGISIIYLFAFISFYLQIPGLYGNNGILPARVQLSDTPGKTLIDKVHNKPTLLWFSTYLGLNTEYMMDLLSLVGILISFSGFISQKFCIAPIFAALWSLYFSLYQVGQTFMWFQWDILLLETGFLCIFLAPFRHQKKGIRPEFSSKESIMFWMVKWLLFRLMFSSGVVKLQSNCPTWWGLTALNVHFESQPLPTPLAWYSHHLPDWVLQLGTVHANIVEMALPLLFFIPIRSVRVVGFYNQLFLQLCIIITGNYNFFNFLTIVLLFSLLDDGYFYSRRRAGSGRLTKVAILLINVALHSGVLYFTHKFYNVRLNDKMIPEAKIAFTRKQFDEFINRIVPLIVYVGCFSLLVVIYRVIMNILTSNKDLFGKINDLVATLFYACCAGFIFGLSLVPFSAISPNFNSSLISDVKFAYSKIDHLHIVNSYGLFRRMTGVGGRPEVVIEGSNSIEGPWTEYHFRYKPGDVNSSLPFVAPYQPRLDWQMWFAALGTYHQNPWIMSLAYKLLTGQPEVMKLLDGNRQEFQQPPRYLKASLYHYHYTHFNEKKSTWWTREKVGEYFPIFTKDHAPLVDYLKNLKIIGVGKKETVSKYWKTTFDTLRVIASNLDPVVFIWSMFFTGFAIISFTIGPPQRQARRNK